VGFLFWKKKIGGVSWQVYDNIPESSWKDLSKLRSDSGLGYNFNLMRIVERLEERGLVRARSTYVSDYFSVGEGKLLMTEVRRVSPFNA